MPRGRTPHSAFDVGTLSASECLAMAVFLSAVVFACGRARRRARLQALLIKACKDGNAEVVQALLQSGASCNTENGDGELPLVAAAARGRLDVMRVLLASCAIVDALDAGNDGGTALLCACMRGRLRAVELLLAHGASGTAHMNGCWSSLDLIATVEEEISELRRSVELSGQQPWHPRPEDLEAVLLVLRRRAKPLSGRQKDAPSSDAGG